VESAGGAPFNVTIDGACGNPSMWQRFTEWTDDVVVAALELVER
jgi:hypothetical protein